MPDEKHSETQSSTEVRQDTSSKKPTPTKRARKTTKTGSLASTKSTTKTLEQEAKEFRKKKSPPVKPKPMTSRIYLAGQAMSALLTRSQGPVRREDIKKEAYEWADYFLSDE